MRYRRVKQLGATYFFTLVTFDRVKLFADGNLVSCWHASVEKVRKRRPFTIEAEVILPDHLHMLWTMPDYDDDYATRIRLVKSDFTKFLCARSATPSMLDSRMKKGERDVWQRRYWEHTIRDDDDFRVRLDYIHFNPVNHGLAKRAADWPFSTFQSWVVKGAYDPWWGSDDMPPLPEWAGSE